MTVDKSSTKNIDKLIDVGGTDPQTQCLNYQLEFLKLENDSINQTIKRIDENTQAIKNWTILIWAGSISLLIGKPELRKFIFLTAFLPFLFWVVDGRWRRIQRQFMFRQQKISEFLNSNQLLESFEKRKMVGFTVLDPRGKQYQGMPEYESFISMWRSMKFITVGGIYFWLVLLSLLIGLFFAFIVKSA